jgi:hypothetical protein
MGWGAKKSPATGRSKREAVNHRNRSGGGPRRENGRIVRGGRLAFARKQATRGKR